MYDPMDHADRLGLTVRHAPSLGTLGLYAHGTIWLRAGLSRRVERCVLAHEISHAIHGDEPTNDPALYARREQRADREAASWPLSKHDLRRCAAVTDDLGAWALELDVTGWILTARLHDLERQAS
ncbi:ImmA/IrrE family metallo-endopeptidase [Kocuria sp. UBA1838]|uniref:ImmA/IrrE family metallo-endopeptidase n=1 Tax=Kocuria sp. UBA1838 TaxID=1946673 RepID=UPI00257C5D57|nr:ImmA/IrrE family metallo-endopeptidase [Kocuria sp. UBA1838]